MKSLIVFGLAALAALLVTLPNSTSSISEEFPSIPTLVSKDNSVVLQQKIIPMHIPEDNTLPWAFVEGKVINPAEGYPVIIQIYKDDEPVHFAQTDVREDGSYEYKFRARNVDGDRVINIFQGDYTVKIFKTVYVTPTAKIV
ncbi:MAG TPA: hypothetical protein VD699_05530 [Nitrosopumilaceae archaeon]|nr:hypothetical protein [Nitrosopumilaceae archaeon]HXV39011.1 hypothetical protein [Nitrosopumilaceae archaeon]